MTREEYLNQMQQYREELQENARQNRENLDYLEDNYRKLKQQLFEEHEEKKRQYKKLKLDRQHEVERKIHELKVQWAKEYQIDEVKVVE